jgi:L,D-transpeptidase YbiS
MGTLAICVLTGCGIAPKINALKNQSVVSLPLDVLISISDQKLHLLRDSEVVRSYKISTGANGAGEEIDSGKTPRGLHRISEKLGANAPDGLVFDSLVATSQIADSTWIDKPPVTTRILVLDGREQRNLNTRQRMIYIHGSPIEKLLGQAASGGCIRLSVRDVKELFDLTTVGGTVDIFEEGTVQALSIRLQRREMYKQLVENAKLGVDESIHQLCFSHRYGTPEIGLDYTTALQWCSAGADANIPASMTLLAEILFEGLAATPDIENGILWYLRAATLGHPFARKRAISILQDPNFAEMIEGQSELLMKLRRVEAGTTAR